jgi:hypothetical protein
MKDKEIIPGYVYLPPFYIVYNYYRQTAPVSAKSGLGIPSVYDENKSNLIYGLSGNVAEMLIDENVIGGSYLHSLEKCKIGATMDWNANNPTKWLGFRCIMYHTE